MCSLELVKAERRQKDRQDQVAEDIELCALIGGSFTRGRKAVFNRM